MKRTLILLAMIPAVAIALILCLHTTSLSYLYCLLREPELLKSRTRQELESRLIAFYSVSEIDPARTVWNLTAPWNRIPPGDEHTTLRYLIFGREPLDVIVADDGRIVDMFCAYE